MKVAPRKHGTARTIAVRGKRKRAVDFFKEDLPAETFEQPKATGGTEVLEKAYQKAQAMAMAAVPILRTDASPHADPSSDDDAKNDSDQRPQSGTSREGLSGPESTQKHTAGGKGSSPEVTASDTVGEHLGPVQRETEAEGARAVEAEGLIWLDDEQRTAYSVRYGRMTLFQHAIHLLHVPVSMFANRIPSKPVGSRTCSCPQLGVWCNTLARGLFSFRHGYRIDVQGAQDSVSGHEYGRILSQMRGGSALDEDGDIVSIVRTCPLVGKLMPSFVAGRRRGPWVAATSSILALPNPFFLLYQTSTRFCAKHVLTLAFRFGCQNVEVAAAASKRLRYRGARERDAEMAKQAAVLQDVPEGDVFSEWAKAEDEMTQRQWQPLRSVVGHILKGQSVERSHQDTQTTSYHVLTVWVGCGYLMLGKYLKESRVPPRPA